MTKVTVEVLRPMVGDKEYAEGDRRELDNPDALRLEELGAVKIISAEQLADEAQHAADMARAFEIEQQIMQPPAQPEQEPEPEHAPEDIKQEDAALNKAESAPANKSKA